MYRYNLIRTINIVEDLGYEVIPFKVDKKYKASIFFREKHYLDGVLLFESHFECLKESYYKLYLKLNKENLIN